MPFRMSLKKLIRRDPASSLRARAAELSADLARVSHHQALEAPSPVAPVSEVSPALAELIARHRDLVRQSEARGLSDSEADPLFEEAWSVFRQACSFPIVGPADFAAKVEFMAAEITEGVERGEVDTATHAWACLRADLLSPEPPVNLRATSDADLVALLPAWEATRANYDRACQRQTETEATAIAAGRPGPAPSGAGSEWEAWHARSREWRDRTGINAAEEASGVACRALGKIEERIAKLPAASLAGLRLKARVAQRCDGIDIGRPDGFDEGLTRDLLAFTADADVDWRNPPPGFMASPAIEPTSFIAIPNGLRIELERLRGIAQAQYERRAASLSGSRDAADTQGLLSAIREDLFLPALAAAVDPDSDEAVALAALGRTPHGDAELLRLGRQFDALIAERQLIEPEHDQVEGVWASTAPERPACLVLRESDRTFRLLRRTVLAGEMEGQNIRSIDIDAIRGRRFSQGVSRPVMPEDSLPAGAHTVEENQPWPEAQARADEIVAAWDAWQEQIDRHNVESGMQAAEERLDAIDAKILALVDRIADLPATTAEGMRLKLRASAVYVEEHNSDFPNGRLLNSLLRDAKGETPPQAERGEASTAPAPLDLQDASINQLARLYDYVSSIAQIASTAVNAPMGWDDRRLNLNSIGRLLEAEHSRLDELAERVAAEVRDRRPADVIDSEDRLATIVKRQMEVFSAIDDPEIATEVQAAWPVWRT